MTAGVTTLNINSSFMLDEVLGNRAGNTVKVPTTQLAAQLGLEITQINYETLALLSADLSDEGTRAAVWGDPVEANRGLYKKTSEGWVWYGDLPISAIATARLDALNGRVVSEASRAMAAEGELSNITADLQSQLDALSAGSRQRGLWDASAGSFPSSSVQAGDRWDVSVPGTVDGQVFVIGDQLLALINTPSTSTFAANWAHVPTASVVAPIIAESAANAVSRAVTSFIKAAPELEVIAHRGFAYDAPENTLLAIEYAIARGARSIEFDISMSADGTPWLHHDSTVDRVTDGTGTFTAIDDEELGALRIDSSMNPPWDIGLTPLIDVLPVLARAGVRVYPELKNLRNIDDVDTIVALFQSAGLSAQVHYGKTGATADLVRVRSLDEACALTYFATTADATFWSNISIVSALGRAEAGVYFPNITNSVVSDLANIGVGILGWTPNKPDQVAALRAAGCHRVMADYFLKTEQTQ